MKITYCIECAAPLTKRNEASYDCPNGHTFWNNPKTTVAIIFLKDDKILVAKRGIEPRKGTYDLPGGFIDPGENVTDAARREAMEETGVQVAKIRILGSYGAEYLENVWVCDLITFAEEWNGTPVAQDDVAGLEWQPLSFLDSELFTAPYPNFRQFLETELIQ